MNLLDLVVTIKADDQASSKIEGVSTKSIAMGSAIGSTFGNLIASGVQAAASAVLDFGKQSIETGMNFDSAMSQVAATMGVTTADIGDLTAVAKEMGATTSFSATEAAEALNFMALAGYDSQTSISMLPNVLNLAAAGGMDLASASDMVTDSQTALGLSLEETNTLVDQMAQTASKSNTSVAQLGDAILTVGGTAKNLSGGITEMNTVLGVMADNGIKGSEAGTHLRNIILSLTAPTDTAAKALADLGVSATDAEGNMRPLEDVMQDFNAAFADMTAEEKTQALNKIFNKTDLSAVNALLDTSVDRWEELGASIDDAAGAAEKMAQTQLDNLEGDLTLLQSAVEGVQIELAAGLTPALRDMVSTGSDGLSKMASQLQAGDLIGGFTTLGQTVTNVATVFLQALPQMVNAGVQMIAGFVSGFAQGLPTMIPALVQCVVDMAMVLVQNVPLLIEAALQLVQGLVQGLIQAIPILVAAVPQLVQSAADALLTGIPMIIDAAVQLFGAIVDALPQIIAVLVQVAPQITMRLAAALIENAPTLISAAIQLFTAILTAVPTIIATLLPMIPQLIVSWVQGLLEGGAQIVAAVLSVFGQLPEVIQGPLEFIGNLIMTVFSAIAGVVTPIIETIGAGISWLAEQFSFLGPVVEGIGSVFGFVADGIGAAWDFITGKSSEASSQTAETVTSNMQLMSDGASLSLDGLQMNADSAFSSMLQSGESNSSQMLSTVDSNISSLYSNGSSYLSSLNSEGSASISSLNSTVSSQTSSMLSTGTNNFSNMQNKANASFGNIQSKGTSSFSQMSSSVSASASSMESSVNASLNNIGTTSSSAFTQISSTAESQMNALSNSVNSAMESATNSINSATQSMTSAMQSGCNSMTNSWASMRFSTPHIPLPHFSVSGRLDPNVPSVPSFSVSWYKKGAILEGATIFGMMGNKLLGGGEAGKEAVLPIDKLSDYVREGVRAEMDSRSYERNIVFNVEINNTGDAVKEGRRIGEALYTEYARLERRTA